MHLFQRKPADQEPEWDPEFEPLMKVLLSKRGVKTKSASEVGKKKVDYFRGKDFKKFVLGGGDLLNKKCKTALNATLEGKAPANDKDVEKLGAELIQRSFCYRAMYKPLNPNAKSDSGEDKKPKKWPDRLGRTPLQNFDPDGFYVITYEGGKGYQHFLLALIILGVLLACMFPVWPMWAKIGLWYISVIFLSIYFGLLLLRIIVYTLFWIVGFDFWIFPNINDEYCGFLDSFQPVYSWEKRKDDILMLVVRFGSLAIVAAACEQIATTTSLSDVKDFVTSSYVDVIDWGVDKLTMLPGGEKLSLPSVEQLEKTLGEDNASGDNSSNDSAWADVARQGAEANAQADAAKADTAKADEEEEVAA